MPFIESRESHPLKRILYERGHTITWLAHQAHYDAFYTGKILGKRFPASAAFRARVAEVLNLPEEDLFDPDPARTAVST